MSKKRKRFTALQKHEICVQYFAIVGRTSEAVVKRRRLLQKYGVHPVSPNMWKKEGFLAGIPAGWSPESYRRSPTAPTARSNRTKGRRDAMSDARPQPQHEGPLCHADDCEGTMIPGEAHDGRAVSPRGLDLSHPEIVCAVCGNERTASVAENVLAWYGVGAYQQRLHDEKHGGGA